MTLRVRLGLNGLEDPFPGAVRRPPAVALVQGLPVPEPLLQFPPRDTRADPEQDPVDHHPVISPTSATAPGLRQMWCQLRPLVVRKITPPHDQHNGPWGDHMIRRTEPKACLATCWFVIVMALPYPREKLTRRSCTAPLTTTPPSLPALTRPGLSQQPQDLSGGSWPGPRRLARHLAALPKRPDSHLLADAAGGPGKEGRGRQHRLPGVGRLDDRASSPARHGGLPRVLRIGHHGGPSAIRGWG